MRTNQNDEQRLSATVGKSLSKFEGGVGNNKEQGTLLTEFGRILKDNEVYTSHSWEFSLSNDI